MRTALTLRLVYLNWSLTSYSSHTQIMKNLEGTQALKKDATLLPSALEHLDELLKNRKPAVFLDYDGCLTPIVPQPDMAILSPEMRNVLKTLAAVCTVAVVSGRDRMNVQELVQLDNLYFAGSHGFDIVGPDGVQTEPGGAGEVLPALEEAEQVLNRKLSHIKGMLVERKRYAIAVHFRNVAEGLIPEIKQVVDEVLGDFPQLKKGLGKMIFELKPNLDWHKGKAVLWLLESLELNNLETLPIYIGDDITDEDAFAALQGKGVGILVGAHDEETAATYRLESVEEVQLFLQRLIETITRRKV